MSATGKPASAAAAAVQQSLGSLVTASSSGSSSASATTVSASSPSSSATTTTTSPIITPERWLMLGNSSSSSSSAGGGLGGVGAGSGGGGGGNNCNTNNIFCWPMTAQNSAAAFAQFMHPQQQQQQQHSLPPEMLMGCAASGGGMSAPSTGGGCLKASGYAGPMMAHFVDNNLQFAHMNNNNHHNLMTAVDLGGGGGGGGGAGSIAVGGGSAGCLSNKGNNNHSHNHNRNNATVQIEIQCINHSNPININSPSGMNNVANMSCGNMHYHHHHPMQQQQQLQQQQQQQMQQHNFPTYPQETTVAAKKFEPLANCPEHSAMPPPPSAFYRSRFQQPPPSLLQPHPHQQQPKHQFFCAPLDSTASACASATSAAAAINFDPYDTVDVPFLTLAAAASAAAEPQAAAAAASAPNNTSCPMAPGFSRPDQFAAITHMAMRGCELAERLAHTHRNRPCFKKIDSLCARMKQDLVRPDSVLANINSQGMAWAVKDFIFVFTRIINAWIIIKGYVHQTPEGLAKVKAALSPEFGESFGRWQAATAEFVDSLIKSFVNLDQMVQSQRNAFLKYEAAGGGGGGSGAGGQQKAAAAGQQQGSGKREQQQQQQPMPMMGGIEPEHLLLMDESAAIECMYKMFAMAEKPGTAEPMMAAAAAAADSSPKKSQPPLQQQQQFLLLPAANYLANVIRDSEETQRQAMEKGTYFKTGLYNPLKKGVGETAMMGGGGGGGMPNEAKSIFTQQQAAVYASPPRVLNRVQQLDCLELSGAAGGMGSGGGLEKENPPSKGGETSAIDVKLEHLLTKICSLNEAKYFFSTQFTKNYFPDFQSAVPNYLDLRTIIVKTQIGGYGSLYEIVHDLRQIVYSAQCYLRQHPHIFLANSIVAFERQLDAVLGDGEQFGDWEFGHITGQPGEPLQPKGVVKF